MKNILKIKDIEIPISIKNYKTAKTMKIYFKEESLVVTKSPYVPKREVDKFIKQNEEKIYEKYKKIEEIKRQKKGRWEKGIFACTRLYACAGVPYNKKSQAQE